MPDSHLVGQVGPDGGSAGPEGVEGSQRGCCGTAGGAADRAEQPGGLGVLQPSVGRVLRRRLTLGAASKPRTSAGAGVISVAAGQQSPDTTDLGHSGAQRGAGAGVRVDERQQLEQGDALPPDRVR